MVSHLNWAVCYYFLAGIMKNIRIIIFLSSLGIILLLGNAGQVFAHATPTTYEPEASAVLEKVPGRVRIHFSERIEPKASSIIIFGPDGSHADNTLPTVDLIDSHFFSIGTKDAGEGIYAVSWQVVSADDGHFTKGAFIFSVGKETSSAEVIDSRNTFSVIHSSTITEGIMVWIELLGQAILFGCLISLFFWRRLINRFGDELSPFVGTYRNRFSSAIVLGVFLILVGTFSYVLLQSNHLAELQNTNFADGFNSFSGTVAGSFALYRALVAVSFFAAFLGIRKRIFAQNSFQWKEGVLFLLLFLIFIMRARVSHAAASQFYPMFSIAINFAHLVFKNAWVGSLLAVGFLLFPLLKQSEKTPILLNNLLSKFLSVALGIVGITGVYIVWLHLKTPSNILTTDWGMRFIPLLIGATVLIALRLFHQVIIEKLGRKRTWFRFSFPLETIVGILVLFFSSILIITTPPLNQKLLEKTATNQGATIILTEHELQHIFISIKDEQTKKPIEVTDIVVTLFNEEKGIGPIVAETQKRDKGEYVLPIKFFSPPGTWKMQIVARRPHTYDANAEFRINYPNEFNQRNNVETREFGIFEGLLFLLALGNIVFSWMLYRISRTSRNAFDSIANPASIAHSLVIPKYTHWIISFAVVFIILVASWGVYNSLITKNIVPCPHSAHGSHSGVAPCSSY